MTKCDHHFVDTALGQVCDKCWIHSSESELAAIRARDAYFEKEHMRIYGSNCAFDAYAVSDRRTLLRMLDEARDTLFHAQQALLKEGMKRGYSLRSTSIKGVK